MEIRAQRLVYFSPTGTTQAVVKGIAEGVGATEGSAVDLTRPEAAGRAVELAPDELAVIGAPVYGGRLPVDAADRLAAVTGQGTPAIAVVVYGNRHYDDALRELCDLCQQQGFKVVGAGCFIGEHSFSTDRTPIAVGRPDAADLDVARALGEQVGARLAGAADAAELPSPTPPGAFPYKERGGPNDICPTTDPDACVRCAACADVCPTGAIAVNHEVATDAIRCILCCACVRACPSQARRLEHPKIQAGAERLHANCSERKAPELFIA